MLRGGCWGDASHVIVTWHSPAAGDMKKVTRKEVGREGEREGRRASGGEGERGREGGREGGRGYCVKDIYGVHVFCAR